MAQDCQIPEKVYNEYLEVLFSISGLKSLYSRKKRYIEYDKLSTSDFELLMQAVGRLIKVVTNK
ncbi:MAG: hypothetical protein HC905_05885 [Bacteroidales bacterium]|nr:hypothetical protein [Bacteroidales bacterium]